MGRRRRGVPFAKGQKLCLFCSGPGLSKTHIWPKWLNELLGPTTHRKAEWQAPSYSEEESSVHIHQGGIFSQKPYLACQNCNTGWMSDFEDEMARFAPSLFSSAETVLQLTKGQQRTMAGWVALITILAEHIHKSGRSVTVSKRDVVYLRKHLVPPREWSIFCSTLEGDRWSARWRHRTMALSRFYSEVDFQSKVRSGLPPNTQVTSLGIGRLFIQVFTCPEPSFIADYRRCAVQTKLSQIWPIPTNFLGFTRPLKFPTNLVLTDEAADELGEAYMNRINEMLGSRAL